MKTKITSIFFTLMALIVLSCEQQRDKNGMANSFSSDNKPINPQQKYPAQNLLLGEWSRMGSPCVMKITAVLSNEKLEVEYFDPKPINIGKANWTKTGTLLSIYVELRDDNYQGSNYKLNYIPERDFLVGEYFQVTDSIAYPVEFARIK